MKTAKEWRIEVQDNDCASYSGSLDRFIRAIQLDVMKEGARRAAEIDRIWQAGRRTYQNPSICAHTTPEQAILTAAEQWTEKDL